MYKLRSSLAVTAAFFLCSAAQAVTLDFNQLHHTGDVAWAPNPYQSSGYTVSNNCGNQGQCFAVLGTAFPIPRYNLDLAGANLSANNPFSTTTVAMTSGASFNFVSIDLADGANAGFENGVPVVMQFTFNYLAGGSATQFVALDNVTGGQTFIFNQTGLSSVNFVNLDNGSFYYQFDNVVVTSPVPEPAGLALMLGGLAAVGAAARRHNHA